MDRGGRLRTTPSSSSSNSRTRRIRSQAEVGSVAVAAGMAVEGTWTDKATRVRLADTTTAELLPDATSTPHTRSRRRLHTTATDLDSSFMCDRRDTRGSAHRRASTTASSLTRKTTAATTILHLRSRSRTAGDTRVRHRTATMAATLRGSRLTRATRSSAGTTTARAARGTEVGVGQLGEASCLPQRRSQALQRWCLLTRTVPSRTGDALTAQAMPAWHPRNSSSNMVGIVRSPAGRSTTSSSVATSSSHRPTLATRAMTTLLLRRATSPLMQVGTRRHTSSTKHPLPSSSSSSTTSSSTEVGEAVVEGGMAIISSSSSNLCTRTWTISKRKGTLEAAVEVEGLDAAVEAAASGVDRETTNAHLVSRVLPSAQAPDIEHAFSLPYPSPEFGVLDARLLEANSTPIIQEITRPPLPTQSRRVGSRYHRC